MKMVASAHLTKFSVIAKSALHQEIPTLFQAGWRANRRAASGGHSPAAEGSGNSQIGCFFPSLTVT